MDYYMLKNDLMAIIIYLELFPCCDHDMFCVLFLQRMKAN